MVSTWAAQGGLRWFQVGLQTNQYFIGKNSLNKQTK